MHSHWRTASASGPTRRYFENEVWSKTVTFSRVLACSAAVQGSQFCLPQEYSMSGCSSDGAKKLARSQPIRLPKLAFAATRWAYSGERRNGRAVAISRLGQGIA